jgi:hypothetical protein
MSHTPPIPPELWEQIPPPVQAMLEGMVAGYERQLAKLEREVAELKVSVFQIALARRAPVLAELLGKRDAGVVTSDRAKAYDSRPLQRRQLCWAQLRRDFQAMSDRGGAAKTTGQILLEHSNLLFTYWRRLREGRLARAPFRWKLGQVRRSFQRELAAGARARCPKTAATCLELISMTPVHLSQLLGFLKFGS